MLVRGSECQMQQGETKIFFFGAQDILTASTARPRHSEVIYKTNKKIQYLKTLLALQKIVVKKFSIFPDSK